MRQVEPLLTKDTLMQIVVGIHTAFASVTRINAEQRQQLAQLAASREEALLQQMRAAQLQLAAAREERLARMRQHIADEVLNLRCPRCRSVFFDHSGCDALRCDRPGCGAAFCVLCLLDCGADAHPHCKQVHGRYFSPPEVQRAAHASRSTALLQGVFDGLQGEDAAFRRDLLAALARDLQDAGVDPSAIRVEGPRAPAPVAAAPAAPAAEAAAAVVVAPPAVAAAAAAVPFDGAGWARGVLQQLAVLRAERAGGGGGGVALLVVVVLVVAVVVLVVLG